MKQTSSLTRNLAAAQSDGAIVYRLYTESFASLAELTARYFAGATLFDAIGVWQGAREFSTIIEIIGKRSDLQSIVHLANDIREVNNQSCVLLTRASVTAENITADGIVPLGKD